MESVGNSMSNVKFEGCLRDVKRPDAGASKWVFIINVIYCIIL